MTRIFIHRVFADGGKRTLLSTAREVDVGYGFRFTREHFYGQRGPEKPFCVLRQVRRNDLELKNESGIKIACLEFAKYRYLEFEINRCFICRAYDINEHVSSTGRDTIVRIKIDVIIFLR